MTRPRPAGTLPTDFLAGANPAAKRALRNLLSQAGIRMRLERERVAFRSDPTPTVLVSTKRLQRKSDGKLREDAGRTLRSGDLLSDKQAEENARLFRERYRAFIPNRAGKAEKIFPTSLDVFQAELLWNLDEVSIIQRWVDEWGPGIRLHRVVTGRALHFRDLLWRLASAHLQDGLSLQEMIDQGRWPQLSQVSGAVISQAAVWLVAPMAARLQPMAAAFSTVRGAEIVAIPQGAWERDPYQPLLWPTGFGSLRLGGSGEEAYAIDGDTSIPHSVATDLLDEQCAGVNQLMLTLTDPGRWTRGSRSELDCEERNIAWSTVNVGLSAIKEVARQWGNEESIWAAFRSLGILAGYWSKPSGPDVKISEMLIPETLSNHVVPYLKPSWLAQWYGDVVVANWANALSEMFPRSSPGEAAGGVQELRNLVHGTGARPVGSRTRSARLLALSSTGTANLQLVRDIATMWWLAVIQNTDTHAIAGGSPF